MNPMDQSAVQDSNGNVPSCSINSPTNRNLSSPNVDMNSPSRFQEQNIKDNSSGRSVNTVSTGPDGNQHRHSDSSNGQTRSTHAQPDRQEHNERGNLSNSSENPATTESGSHQHSHGGWGWGCPASVNTCEQSSWVNSSSG